MRAASFGSEGSKRERRARWCNVSRATLVSPPTRLPSLCGCHGIHCGAGDPIDLADDEDAVAQPPPPPEQPQPPVRAAAMAHAVRFAGARLVRHAAALLGARGCACLILPVSHQSSRTPPLSVGMSVARTLRPVVCVNWLRSIASVALLPQGWSGGLFTSCTQRMADAKRASPFATRSTVATQHTRLQHCTTRCNTVQHVATQSTMLLHSAAHGWCESTVPSWSPPNRCAGPRKHRGRLPLGIVAVQTPQVWAKGFSSSASTPSTAQARRRRRRREGRHGRVRCGWTGAQRRSVRTGTGCLRQASSSRRRSSTSRQQTCGNMLHVVCCAPHIARMPLVGQQAAAHVQGTHALEHSAAQRLAALRWMAWAATAAWRFVAAAPEMGLVRWLAHCGAGARDARGVADEHLQADDRRAGRRVTAVIRRVVAMQR